MTTTDSTQTQVIPRFSEGCHVQITLPTVIQLNQLGSVIEFGIKFFLYQKGQLSVPFESLRNNIENIGCNCEYGDRVRGIFQTPRSLIEIPETMVEQNERRRFLLKEQRRLRLEQQRLKQSRIAATKETRARSSLQSAFDALAQLFTSLAEVKGDDHHYLDFAIILAFGASIRNAKELIIFRSQSCLQNDENIKGEGFDVEKISKQFCKTVIMSKYFNSFVCKRLHRSSVHLNLVIRDPLPLDIMLKNSLFRIDNLNLPFDHLNDLDTSIYKRPTMFLINFSHSVVPPTCFENLNDYCAYTIPMSFKGM